MEEDPLLTPRRTWRGSTRTETMRRMPSSWLPGLAALAVVVVAVPIVVLALAKL